MTFTLVNFSDRYSDASLFAVLNIVSFVFLLCNKARPNEVVENLGTSDIPIIPCYYKNIRFPTQIWHFLAGICMRVQLQINIGGRSHSSAKHSEAAQYRTQGNLVPRLPRNERTETLGTRLCKGSDVTVNCGKSTYGSQSLFSEIIFYLRLPFQHQLRQGISGLVPCAFHCY